MSDDDECFRAMFTRSNSFEARIFESSKLTMWIVAVRCAFESNHNVTRDVHAPVVIVFEIARGDSISNESYGRIFHMCDG